MDPSWREELSWYHHSACSYSTLLGAGPYFAVVSTYSIFPINNNYSFLLFSSEPSVLNTDMCAYHVQLNVGTFPRSRCSPSNLESPTCHSCKSYIQITDFSYFQGLHQCGIVKSLHCTIQHRSSQSMYIGHSAEPSYRMELILIRNVVSSV